MQRRSCVSRCNLMALLTLPVSISLLLILILTRRSFSRSISPYVALQTLVDETGSAVGRECITDASLRIRRSDPFDNDLSYTSHRHSRGNKSLGGLVARLSARFPIVFVRTWLLTFAENRHAASCLSSTLCQRDRRIRGGKIVRSFHDAPRRSNLNFEDYISNFDRHVRLQATAPVVGFEPRSGSPGTRS